MSFWIYFFDNLEGQMWHSNIHWRSTLTNSTQNKLLKLKCCTCDDTL
jgi:hypothetical protein